VYSMSEDEIQDYADSDEPMDKAGAYAVQGFFGRYIKGLKGSYANVMGLPISMVYQEMKKF
ncbi:MAG: Maf family protein, partial [Lachnospiraceae bacterium]|nr:Maf family protein [Lachnospiraceae bacterium]